MKLSVNEAKLTGFCARNSATIQQFFVSKFALGSVKLPGLLRNGPQDYSLCLPGLEPLSNVNPEIEFTSFVSCAKRYAVQQNCEELLNLYLFTYL